MNITNEDKIIFLDVDGVLNSDRFERKMFRENGVRIHRDMILDERAIEVLKYIVQQTGAKIVLSSDWRLHKPHYDALVFYLSKKGMNLADCTGDYQDSRGLQINNWLMENNFTGRFAIIDDRNDMEPNMSKLVQTTEESGLLPYHADRVIQLLNRGY